MKTKMKVKHLVMTFTGILLLAVFMTQVLIPTIQTKEIEKIQVEDVIGSLANESLSDSERKGLIEGHLLTGRLGNYPYDLTIGPTMTEGPSNITNAVRIPHLKWYKENNQHDSVAYYQATVFLAYNYAKQGQIGKGIQLLDPVIEKMQLERKNEFVYKAYVELLALVDQEKALVEINHALHQVQDDYIASELIRVKTDILVSRKDYQQAIASIEEMEKVKSYVGNTYFTTMKQNIDAWKSGDELHHVTGSLKTADGEAISFAKVYLRTPNDTNHSIIHEEEAYVATTDEQGDFQIGGVPTGDYQIFLGVDVDQISGYTWTNAAGEWYSVTDDQQLDITLQPLISTNSPVNYQEITSDEITFDWDAVDDAAYYKIGFGIEYAGGGVASVSNRKIEDDEVTISITDLYHKQIAIAHQQNEEGEMEVVPESILGFANPTTDFYWYVEAYSKNNQLLSTSKGYRLTEESMDSLPFFSLKQRKLTEADQLLLDGEIEKALENYKTVLEDNPKDTHALRMVALLLENGNRDYKQGRQEAIPYLKSLAELTNQHHYWERLALNAFEEGDWDSYFKYYNNQLESLGDVPSDYSTYMYSLALMKNGEIEQAKGMLQKLVESDDSHRFMPALATLQLYQTNSFEQAKQIARKYPELSYQSQTSWYERLSRIETQIASNNEKKQQFEQGLEMYMTGKESELRDWLDQITRSDIKTYFEKLIRR